MRKLLTILALSALTAGCGGGDKSKKPTTPAGKPNAAAKAVAQRYLDAYTARNAKQICSTLAAKVQKELADNKGTCIKTIRFSLKGIKGDFPKLVVKQAYAEGPKAIATITSSQREITLQVEGGAWKVADGGQ
jgi:hypothetical protein